MTAESFDALYNQFQKGLTVNPKTFKLYYKKNKKELEYIRYENKEYVIIDEQFFWVPMVIGAFMGLDVIGTTWVPKDGNCFNYHPGNYLFLTEKEKEKYLEERTKTKLTWEAFDEIKESKLTRRNKILPRIAEKYNVTLEEVRRIKYSPTFKVFGFGYQILKSQNRMI